MRKQSGRDSAIERRFRRIARSLRPFELQDPVDEPLLTEDHLIADFREGASDGRFLGYYTRRGIFNALEAYGLLDQLRGRGFTEFELVMDTPALSAHRLRLYGDRQPSPDVLLLDLCLHLGTGPGFPGAPPYRGLTLLVLDWLQMQDPRSPFDPTRLLPGQVRPGLGLGLEVAALLQQVALRLGLDGLLAVPAWYHNAVFYSQRCTFVEPTIQGWFEAVQRDGQTLSVAELSWAFELGCVREVVSGSGNTGEPIAWRGRSQVWPLAPLLRTWFERPAWRGVKDATRDSCRFEIDIERLKRLRAARASM